MNIHIETERLILRELERTDLYGMFALDSNPEVHTYLGNKPVSSLKETEEIIENIRSQYKEFGIGRLAAIDKKNGDFVGWGGLKYEQKVRKEFSYYDLGYRLRKKYWGQGFGTEIAEASLKYGFEKRNLQEIFAAADVDNLGSNKILQKIGLKFIETFTETFMDETTLCNWYGLERSTWIKKNIS